ncbi:hypothetical protein AEAC466_04305 [Asticcacaulis sp. AC466]|uniref:Pam3-gp28 family putative phage holin n=1 Tax=Asticcacaulis sp. AC466 TaxID=1282362 RepID=UPI0003C3FD70|nr:hypothetical protein [Asticcacaulis sp. AC466]ESQ85394.1 hypothetical protein AEAC466_04305 [Asticcacaulis sp. AC466]
MSDETPVVIDPSVTATQAWGLLRQFLLLFGGTILGKFLSKEQIDYLLSNEFVQFVGAAAAFGALVYGQVHLRLTKKTLIAAADAAPNSQFVVTKPSVTK